MKLEKKLVAPLAVAIIVAGGLGFYGGTKYGGQSGADSHQPSQQSRAQGNRFGGQQGGGFVSGQVLSKDAQSITVQGRDGSSRIVFYSSSTSVVKPVSGSINDVSAGADVVVGGTQNSDGSITAQSIQLRPANSPASAQ